MQPLVQIGLLALCNALGGHVERSGTWAYSAAGAGLALGRDSSFIGL